MFGAGDALAQAARSASARRRAPPPRPPPQPDGIVAWIAAKQAEFYRAMAGTIRSARTDGSALWFLFGIAFLYGIFHAAGPGHGKAVISSYMVANEEAWTRGVVLSFASAMLQALVAVIIVGVAAVLLNATARQMCDAEWVIAMISYALIALLGRAPALGQGARVPVGGAGPEAHAGAGRGGRHAVGPWARTGTTIMAPSRS